MQPIRGITYKVVSVLLIVTMWALVKEASKTVPLGELVFFRSFFAAPVILVWLAATGDLRSGLKMSNPLSHLWRGVFGTVSMGLTFSATALLPLPEATAIFYAAPLIMVVFAAMFLGEEVRAFRLTAVGIGLVGVLIVLSPRLTVLNGDAAAGLQQTLGAVVAMAAAVMIALTQVFVRKIVQGETTSSIVFYFSLISTVLSLMTLPWGWVMPDLRLAVILVLCGLLGGVGQIFLTSCYRYAPMGVVAPFEYASMLFSLAIGYFAFHEVPTLTMLLGAAIVIAAGLFIILRERQLGLDRARQRQASQPGGG